MEPGPNVTAVAERPIPPYELALRGVLIAAQIVAVLYFGQPGALFFYQVF